jgi:hypothetical protein
MWFVCPPCEWKTLDHSCKLRVQALEIYSGYGETQEKQLEAATVSMLKQRDQDTEISKAEIEFYRVQKVEDQFHKDFDGLDST